MQKGNRFELLNTACDAIKAFVLDQGESFKTILSDKN